MKHLPLTILMTSLFALGMTTASASSLDLDDVISAIDGEAEIEVHDMDRNTERVNFDISVEDVHAEDFWKPENAGILDDTYY